MLADEFAGHRARSQDDWTTLNSYGCSSREKTIASHSIRTLWLYIRDSNLNKGVWSTYFCEEPSINSVDDRVFERDVLDINGNGDPDAMTRMPGCYPLAKKHAMLSMESQIQILVVAAQRSNKWKEWIELYMYSPENVCPGKALRLLSEAI